MLNVYCEVPNKEFLTIIIQQKRQHSFNFIHIPIANSLCNPSVWAGKGLYMQENNIGQLLQHLCQKLESLCCCWNQCRQKSGMLRPCHASIQSLMPRVDLTKNYNALPLMTMKHGCTKLRIRLDYYTAYIFCRSYKMLPDGKHCILPNYMILEVQLILSSKDGDHITVNNVN